MSLTPKNWKEFQHYSDRKPAWIKLHRVLLDDYQFAILPVASRALAPCLWLLASEYDEGEITASLEEIAFRLHMTTDALSDALHPLIKSGFFTVASDMLAPAEQPASLEKERETQEEREKDSSSDWPRDFREVFWSSYPRKVGKQGALKELDRVRRKSIPWEKLIAAVRAYAATADPNFTKHPQTWLSKGCWDDELAKPQLVPTLLTITPASPSWNPWKSHFRDTGQNARAAIMDKCASDGKPFTVQSEWPPGVAA